MRLHNDPIVSSQLRNEVAFIAQLSATELKGCRKYVFKTSIMLMGLVLAPFVIGIYAWIAVASALLWAVSFICRSSEQRESIRLLRRYVVEGREIEWLEARARVLAGRGTLLASMGPWGISELWWSDAKPSDLDGPVFRWTDGPTKVVITRAGRRRIEAHIRSALYVRDISKRRPEFFDELEKVPCVRIDAALGAVGRSGVLSDPISWPTGDRQLDALREERDRLLDQFDDMCGRAEYEAAAQLQNATEKIEVQLRGGIAATHAI